MNPPKEQRGPSGRPTKEINRAENTAIHAPPVHKVILRKEIIKPIFLTTNTEAENVSSE